MGLAEEVAKLLNTTLIPTTAYDFANGETFVRYEESVRGVDAFDSVHNCLRAQVNDSV